MAPEHVFYFILFYFILSALIYWSLNMFFYIVSSDLIYSYGKVFPQPRDRRCLQKEISSQTV